MAKKLLVIILGIILGITGSILIYKYNFLSFSGISHKILSPLGLQQNKIIGFLPYWLISKADKNYTPYVTDLAYFGLTVNADGTIQKLTNPTETEPGWLTLKSGKLDAIFADAKKNNTKLSLVIFSGNDETIGQLIHDPINNARNLMNDVAPLMTRYGFTDLNLDIESFKLASDEARMNFTRFTDEIHKNIGANKSGTLSIDVSPTALVKPFLIDVKEITPFVDSIVFMTYDFHYQGSSVTGPIAPLNGVGIDTEFDTETAIKEAVKIVPGKKIIMGLPMYGYEWETLNNIPRSAIIPETGITASNRRVEELLKGCATCSARFDAIGKESYVIFKDTSTGTYHQIFYSDEKAIVEKIKLAQKYDLGGMALWALGYEGKSLLNPLKSYKR